MLYFSDGYTLYKNPSPKGGGYSIFNSKNKLIKEEQFLKENFTNNEAELLGVLNALRICKNEDSIITDSQNTLYWIWKGKCGARPDLNSLASEAYGLMLKKKVSIGWLPREFNLAGHYNEQYEKEKTLF